MQRTPRFLVAAVAELFRFLGIASLAESLGALRDEGAALFRYAAAPQLLFVAAFFFLWRDEDRYAAYRPLALVGKALELAAFPLLVLALSRADPLVLPDPGSALLPAAFIFIVDLGGLAALSRGRPRSHRGAKGDSAVSGTSSPHMDDAARSRDNVPRGPEDIERVEV